MRRGCQWRCAQAREPQQRERRAGDAGNLASGKQRAGEAAKRLQVGDPCENPCPTSDPVLV